MAPIEPVPPHTRLVSTRDSNWRVLVTCGAGVLVMGAIYVYRNRVCVCGSSCVPECVSRPVANEKIDLFFNDLS